MNAVNSQTLPPSRTILRVAVLLVIVTVVLATCAQAGTTGTEFQETYDLLLGWAQGYLGKIFAIAAFLIGCAFAAARQTAMPAIFGLVLALIIAFGPSLIERILTATI